MLGVLSNSPASLMCWQPWTRLSWAAILAVRFTRRFLESSGRLPAKVPEKIRKQITLLAENPRHPSLQTKPVQRTPGIYEARVDVSHGMIHERLSEDTQLLRVVGKLDETLKNP